MNRPLTSPFAALRHRSFRLYWIGQCISLIGTWMQRVAQGQLVVELTHSPLKLGLVTAAQFTPMLFITLFAGVLADRCSKRRILFVTQSLLLAQAVILAALTWTGTVRYWHVLILAFSMGVINSFDTPTRQSYLVELAGREDLVNAVALHSMLFNLSRIIGPIIAGFIMDTYSMTACFALNALSFLAVIAGLYLISARGECGQKPRTAVWPELYSGLRYMGQNTAIRDALILLAFISIFGENFNVMITSFNAFTLSNDRKLLGFLWSAMGLGSLLGSLRLALLSHRGVKRGSMILFGSGLALALLALSFGRSFWPAMAALIAIGFYSTSYNNSVNSTLQVNAADEYRGRVMSVYSLFLQGLTPVGSMFFGAVAERRGTPAAIAAGAAGCLVGLLILLVIWRRAVGKSLDHGHTYPGQPGKEGRNGALSSPSITIGGPP